MASRSATTNFTKPNRAEGAVVLAGARLAERVIVGDQAFVRERASVGPGSVIGRGSVVDNDVEVGARVRVQTNVYLTAFTQLEDDVFVGPGVTTTNDDTMARHAPDARLRGATLRRACRVGGGAVLTPGVEIGEEAFVAAGAVVTRDVPPRAAWALEQAGVHPLLARLYAARGVTAKDDLDDDLRRLQPPDGMKGTREAAVLLAEAIAAGQRLCIVADYDCDGATACTVALRGLAMLGAQHVSYVVPDRAVHGYGLTPAIVELALPQRPDLLMTVDNGIASLAGVERADAGVASGLVNTSRQIGGAVGLAAISTIAASAASGYAHAHGLAVTSPLATVNGFQTAFVVLGSLLVAAFVVAGVFLRPTRERVEEVEAVELQEAA
jgi:acetyltransferase-like isoleucine patch superfamily enzyme